MAESSSESFKKKGAIQIGTWNVRTLNVVGRLENLKKEMKRFDQGMVGISEVGWKEDNDFWFGDFRIINTKGIKGQEDVGIVMNKQIGIKVM